MTQSIKTIAVHLPSAAFCSRLLDVAIPLAKAHDATLVGVHVIPAVVVYADATVSMSTEFIVAQQEAFQEDARAIEAAFRQGTDAAGVCACMALPRHRRRPDDAGRLDALQYGRPGRRHAI